MPGRHFTAGRLQDFAISALPRSYASSRVRSAEGSTAGGYAAAKRGSVHGDAATAGG